MKRWLLFLPLLAGCGAIARLGPPDCGNGVIEEGEVCDDAEQNSDTAPDACRTDCQAAACGDGVPDDGEGCDDANADDTDDCLSTCAAASCGDGFAQAGVEECDEGVENSDVVGNACRTDCTEPVCGDGVTDNAFGEACDDGAANSDVDPDACRTDCQVAACGDGVTDTGEECDDANTIDTDDCHNDCTLNACGDGVVDTTEPCFLGPFSQGIEDQDPNTTALNPTSVVLADINANGDLDLLTANNNENIFNNKDSVSVILAVGNGLFAGPLVAPMADGSDPTSLATADFNGDGILDLAISFTSADGVAVGFGNGLGFFPDSVVAPTGDGPFSMVAGDFDGDGDIDLATANLLSSDLSILFNTAGIFAEPLDANGAPIRFTVGLLPSGIAAGDVDKDGALDLAVTSLANNSVDVLLNDGTGLAFARQSFGVGAAPAGVAIADLDGDTFPDLAVSNHGPNDNSAPDSLSLLLNDGTGDFGGAVDTETGDGTRGVVAADLDGDADLDLIAADELAGTISVLLNDGDAGLSAAFSFPVGTGPVSLAVGDINNDGFVDLVVANKTSNNLSLLFANP